jgi:hypothetical protein
MTNSGTLQAPQLPTFFQNLLGKLPSSLSTWSELMLMVPPLSELGLSISLWVFSAPTGIDMTVFVET